MNKLEHHMTHYDQNSLTGNDIFQDAMALFFKSNLNSKNYLAIAYLWLHVIILFLDLVH